jgi:hypothetical protein
MWERKLVTKKISNEHHVAIRCGRKTTSWLVEEVFCGTKKNGLRTYKRWEGIMLTVITEASDYAFCVVVDTADLSGRAVVTC